MEAELQQSKNELQENRTQVTLLQRERDDFAQLALERGKTIQVSITLVFYFLLCLFRCTPFCSTCTLFFDFITTIFFSG